MVAVPAGTGAPADTRAPAGLVAPVVSPVVRAAAPTVPVPADPVVPVRAVRPMDRVVRGRFRPLRRPGAHRRRLRPRVRRLRAGAVPVLRPRPQPLLLPRIRGRPPRPPLRDRAWGGVRECSSSDRVAHSPPTRCRTRRGALDGPTRRNGHGYPPDAVTTRARTPPSVVAAAQRGRRHVPVTESRGCSGPSRAEPGEHPPSAAGVPAGDGAVGTTSPGAGPERCDRARRGPTVGRGRSSAPEPRAAVQGRDPVGSRKRTAGVPGESTAAHPGRAPIAQLTGRFEARTDGGPTTEKTTWTTHREETVVGVTQTGDRRYRPVRGCR